MRRVRPLATLSVLLGLAAASAQAQPAKPPAPSPSPSPSPLPASLPAATAVPSAPAIGCPSLANLRLLLRQSDGKASAAAATLADPKTDHMSCTVLGQDRVNAITDHAALNGNDYDCVGVNGTSVCYWTVAGTVIPADPARATRKAPPAKPAAEKAKR